MIAVTVTIRCNWCGNHITGNGIPIDARHLPARIHDLEAHMAATGNGVTIPSCPGTTTHLCRACDRRGTPPVTNAAHDARRARERVAAGTNSKETTP